MLNKLPVGIGYGTIMNQLYIKESLNRNPNRTGVYWSVHENVTRGLWEPYPVFPLEVNSDSVVTNSVLWRFYRS